MMVPRLAALRPIQSILKAAHHRKTSLIPSLIRSASTQSSSTPAEADFVPVFRFPYVPHLGIFSRIKVYQTAASVTVLLPYVAYGSIVEDFISPSEVRVMGVDPALVGNPGPLVVVAIKSGAYFSG